MLCAARPGTTRLYNRLLHYQVGLIELAPFSVDDIRHILHHYGIQKDWEEVVETLLSITGGNPLVVRAGSSRTFIGTQINSTVPEKGDC